MKEPVKYQSQQSTLNKQSSDR